MSLVARGKCRAVAPLIARHNDPDLSEAERVLLSTHLLRCPCCLARLQEYRMLDQRLRRLPGTTLSAGAREAVLERVAHSTPGFGFPALGPAWRQAWFGAAAAISLTALVLTFGFATLRAVQDGSGALEASAATNHAFAPVLTTTILGANPTSVAASVGEAFPSTLGTNSVRVGQLPVAQPIAVRAAVRAVHVGAGRIAVQFDGARGEEQLVVTRDTIILRSDGRRATLGEIAAGSAIQVLRDQSGAVRQITIVR